VNSSWDLSTHDISILLALVNEMPLDISSEGFSIIGTGVEDVVNTSLTYEKLFVTLFASWLHPEKTRKIKIVGSKKMIVWDGMLFGEEVKIFDKGYEINNNQDTYTNLTQIRNGDIVVPNIQKSEPLKEVVLDFYNKILGEDINRLNTEQLTNNVVEIMEKINLK
jgi:predicted dehydrogenase